MTAKVDFGKIVLNDNPLSSFGPSLTFVGGKDLSTSGYAKNGVRIANNYECNMEVVDKLRREVGKSLSEYDIPTEWYLTLPGWGGAASIHHIKVGKNGMLTPYTLDIRTSRTLGWERVGELLLGMSLKNAKDGDFCFTYNKDKDGEAKIEILNFPDLEDCNINLFREHDGGLEYILWAGQNASTEKFGEAMKIYLSMIYGIGRLRNFTEESTELFAVIEHPEKKYGLSRLLGRELK